MLFGMALLLSVATFAQSISGTIRNASDLPVTAATVSIRSGTEGQNVLSDSKGYFEFNNLGQKKYLLTVSSIGYTTYQGEIQTGTTTEIILQDSEISLQGVEVTGRARKDYNSEYSFSATKIAILNKELPQALSTVTKELIADRGAFQLADAVKIASGVSPSSVYNQYNIRGISQNEEGQIINGLRTRQFYFIQPLTTNIERVEVLKGPASVTFSSVDPGGSINMITKKPLAETRREVSLATGSFNTARATLDFTGPLNESKTLLYRLNGAVQEARSYRDLVKNNALLISPSITYIPNNKTALNTELIFTSMTGNLDRGQPIFGAVAGQTDLNSTPISLNLGSPSDFSKPKELTLMSSLSHKFSEKVSFNAAYMKNQWTEDLQEHRTTNAFAQDMNGNPFTSLVQMQFVQRKQFWNTDNLNAYFNLTTDNGKIRNQLVAGYDLSRTDRVKGNGQNAARGYLLMDGTTTRNFTASNAADYQTIVIDGVTLPKPNVDYFDLNNPAYVVRNRDEYTMNSRFVIPPTLSSSNAIYVQNQIKFGKFSALLSLRQEWFEDIVNYKSNGETTYKNKALIPRLGLTYSLNDDINIYATYLEGFQPQANTTTLLPSTGNYLWSGESASKFDPLTSDLKEIGMKTELVKDRITLNWAIYEINQKNIIMSANDPNNPDALVQRGADRSRGFETDLAGYITPNWQINASYSFIDAVIVNDANEALIGERKENVAKNSGNIWTRYNFSKKLRALGLGVGVNAQGSRIPWFTRAFEVPAYATVDAAIYFTPSKSNAQIALNANNLFDKTYWIGAQTYQRLFPGAPRNFMLTATYKF